jgi:hypothetical protein
MGFMKRLHFPEEPQLDRRGVVRLDILRCTHHRAKISIVNNPVAILLLFSEFDTP